MPPTPDTRLDPALRRLVAALLLGGIMGILDGTMVAVAADTLVSEFDTSLTAVGWVSTAYLLALTATVPVTSWAVGRIGGRRLWLLGLALFLAGSLASALAWDVGSLIAFRVVQGVGAGIVDPLLLILLARAAGPHRAGRVMGLMGLVLPLGPVLGPVVGGMVLDGAGWRWMFLINLPIGAVALLLALRMLPADAEPSPAERGGARLDVIGLALLAPGFTAGVLALSRAAEHGRFTAWPVLAPLTASALLLAGYAVHALPRREGRRRTPPLIDLRLFASRGFTASVTVMGLNGAVTFAGLFVLPLYYQQAHGYGAFAAGLLVAPLGVGAALAMPLAGRLSDGLGSRNLAMGGAALAALGALALTRTGVEDGAWWTVLAACTAGLGLGCVGAPTMGALYRTLPAPLVPQGSSVLYMLNQLGASVGIAVVALIMQTTTGGPEAGAGGGRGAGGAAEAVRGLHAVSWFMTAGILVILAGTAFLPGRPRARQPPRTDDPGVRDGAGAAKVEKARAELGTAGAGDPNGGTQ